MQQAMLLDESVSPAIERYPLVGTQKDIRYYGTRAKSVLNDPNTTGMEFWSINPYIGCAFGCAYCYARYAHHYVMERAAASPDAGTPLHDDLGELPPWLSFERRIFVKRNAPELVRAALRSGSRTLAALRDGETVTVGTATDPYQPAERIFRVTRGVLEVLAEPGRLSVVIITKSPLVTRDVDVLARLAQRSRLTVHVSIITADRELARRLEPRAPTPESRLRAVRRLREAGIDVGVNIMPVLPGITDHPALLTDVVRQITEAGATHIHCCSLRLRASARRRYLPFISGEFPQLAERYRSAFADDHEMSPRYQEGLRRFVSGLCRRFGIHYGSRGAEDRGGAQTSEALERETDDERPAPPAPPPQLELGL
jgi:DNA repair photolyase